MHHVGAWGDSAATLPHISGRRALAVVYSFLLFIAHASNELHAVCSAPSSSCKQ